MLNVLEYPGVPNNLRTYPTEKPPGLLKTLIQQSSSTGDTVLDPFAGSASTLRAARGLGRKSIGFEINQDSWKIGQGNLMSDGKEAP
jgi:site-specific DNA-methyltransferase (adenine-specific)